MTTAVITQPTYLPWLGYFEAMRHADVFVVFDTAQFQRRSWHSRNRLRGTDGEPFWLTVPVASAPQSTPIAEIRVADDGAWAAKHLRAIETSLGGAPHVDAVLDLVGDVLRDPPELLLDLNEQLIVRIAAALGITPPRKRASELSGHGTRSALLVDLCEQVGADRYHSALGSKEYMTDEWSIWEASGLTVTFQEWQHPTYTQPGPGPFVSHLSAIDAIANLGLEQTRDVIGAGGAAS